MNKKLAIVTGASGNLGQAVVKKFLSGGYHVVGTVIPGDPVPLDITDAAFEKKIVDLTVETAAEEMINSLLAAYPSLDAAVLTVGGFAMGHLAETSSSDILKQYRLNFETAYHIARPVFGQMMKQQYGRIFLVGSRPGLTMQHSKGMVAYGLSKSLIFRLAELMNDEAKGRDVVTSVVVPSIIDTPHNRQAMPEADFSTWVKPEAIANVIFFHCSQEAAILREPVIKVYGNS